MATLEVALVQLRTPATQAAALAHAEPFVRQAAATGAELILLPECANLMEARQLEAFADVYLRTRKAKAAKEAVQ